MQIQLKLQNIFKYFIILIISTYYILCISWIIKCLIIIDARCKHVACYITAACFGAIILPSSGSRHQHLFKTRGSNYSRSHERHACCSIKSAEFLQILVKIMHKNTPKPVQICTFDITTSSIGTIQKLPILSQHYDAAPKYNKYIRQ